MAASEQSGPRPDQEGFGEASLGEAQSENPPPDPEYLRVRPEGGDEGADPAERGAEAYGFDQDAEASVSEEQVEEDARRDQAEG